MNILRLIYIFIRYDKHRCLETYWRFYRIDIYPEAGEYKMSSIEHDDDYSNMDIFEVMEKGNKSTLKVSVR